MVPLTEFLEMDEGDREGRFPFIWAVDRKQHLSRVLVAKEMVHSCEERRDFWIMLRALAGIETDKVEEIDIEEKVRTEVVGNIAQGLMKLAGGDGTGIAAADRKRTARADIDRAQLGLRDPHQSGTAGATKRDRLTGGDWRQGDRLADRIDRTAQ